MGEKPMDKVTIKNTKDFVDGFLEEYLADGLGTMSKREIDILVMNLFIKYGGLADASNQDLSILLKTPESRIKGLRYEARLKYPPDPDYVKREFLYILSRAQFDSEKGRIIFAMEDEYLRHAIQGKLKGEGRFADSSFNTEIIKIEQGSLESVIGELYGKEYAGAFHDGFEELEQPEDGKTASSFKDVILNFVIETAKDLSISLVKSRLGI
jgi:hypothetical protein